MPHNVSDKIKLARIYSEVDDPIRHPLERDRGRIVHSKALRRLSNKTQVFAQSPLSAPKDTFRSRLTHSIEVSQIAQCIARRLNLNLLLTECLALAHDIGHSPFGHCGEKVLNQIMANNGGFEHNCQTLRQLSSLENRYYEHPGLNLTQITLLGLMKRGKIYACDTILSQIQKLYQKNGAPLEAQVVDLSDQIAYLHHDLEDGLDLELLAMADLEQNPFWQKTCEVSLQKENKRNTNGKDHSSLPSHSHWQGNHDPSLKYKTIIRESMNVHILKVIHENEDSTAQIKSTSISENFSKMKEYLHANLYNHPQVKEMMSKGEIKIQQIYSHLQREPNKLPLAYRHRIEEFGLPRSICDYIAGMTDGYCISFRL